MQAGDSSSLTLRQNDNAVWCCLRAKAANYDGGFRRRFVRRRFAHAEALRLLVATVFPSARGKPRCSDAARRRSSLCSSCSRRRMFAAAPFDSGMVSRHTGATHAFRHCRVPAKPNADGAQPRLSPVRLLRRGLQRQRNGLLGRAAPCEADPYLPRVS